MKKSFITMLFLSAVSFYGKSQTWNPLGNGFSNAGPTCLSSEEKLYIGASGLNGITVAGYHFNGIGAFDGNRIDSLGYGLSLGSINAISWYNGKLIAGGNFAYAGGPTQWSIPYTGNLAAWDSINGWSSITPLGHPDYSVNAIAEYQGNLYIGGSFVNVNNVAVSRIAKWDGTTWSGVGGGVTGSMGVVRCMAVYHNQLYVGGDFTLAGSTIPTNYIARWNGTQWDSVAGGFNNYVWAFTVDTVADVLYAAGGFTQADNNTALGVAKWDDTLWTPVGVGTDTLWGTWCLAIYDNELYAGGSNVTITSQGDTLNNIYKFNGTRWAGLDGGANNTVLSMTVFQGNLYVGGLFGQVGNNIPANKIACYGTTCPTSVGIAEQTPPVPFKMFPNPNDDVLHIETEEPEQLIFRLNNSSGQLISEIKFSEKLDYSTRSLAAGTYFVQVSLLDGSRIHNEKLIVK